MSGVSASSGTPGCSPPTAESSAVRGSRFAFAVSDYVRRALERYNGSVGHRDYPDRVIVRWTNYWNGADDLGRAPVKRS